MRHFVKQKDSQVSMYQPSEDVAAVSKHLLQDVWRGEEILHESRMEYNGLSVIERNSRDKRTFHSYVDDSRTPEEWWKWKGTRGLARKKAFAQHAHLTSSFLVPNVVPDNSSQEDDIAMANGMRGLVEWQIVNSNYRENFLLASMGVLYNPVTYLRVEYCNAEQEIKVPTEDGYTTEYIMDEELSGTQTEILSASQVLITNAYIQNIQRQRAIVEIEWVEYSELEQKHKDHPHWVFIQEGVRRMYDPDDGLFYDIKDETNPNLAMVMTYKHRTYDAEIKFIDGIYFGNPNVDYNPIRHRDNRNAPKYNVVPFGYHRVNEHFFYFASMMQEVGWDDQLVDALWGVSMNRKFLDLEQPVMFTGVDQIDSSVVFPGSVLSTQNPNARAFPLVPAYNEDFRHLKEAEDSLSEASISETQAGQLPAASQKAFTVSRAEQNARILLSGVMKNLGSSVQQAGELMVDIALQHLTTAEADEIVGGLKYRTFVLQDQKVDGKKVSKEIRFEESLMGRKMSRKEYLRRGAKLLREAGYPNNKRAIYVFNPHLFSKMKYLTRVEPDEMLPRNRAFEQQISERMYTLLRNDPEIEPQALIRNLIETWKPNDVDSLMKSRSVQNIIGGQAIPVENLPSLPAEAMA